MEPKEKPKVFIAATSQEILDKALQRGATLSTSGSPIVGTAGLILWFGKIQKNRRPMSAWAKHAATFLIRFAAKSVLGSFKIHV